MDLQEAELVRSAFVGNGARACVDVCAVLGPDDGMLIGSFSRGGFIVCSEVYPLPYMPTRPFRVNAGAVCSYVLGSHNRLPYLTDLRVGHEIGIVSTNHTKGGDNVRVAVVGRSKIEIRPLRLLVARLSNRDEIAVLLQDDWHIRIFNARREAVNITGLKQGDLVLVGTLPEGRHAGISVSEYIREC